MPITAFEDHVAKSAAKMDGGAGPFGVDGGTLCALVTRFLLINTWLRRLSFLESIIPLLANE